MSPDTRTFALNVLARAALGKSFDFYGARDKKMTHGPLSYRDALAMLLHNALLFLALGPKTLKRFAFIPRLGQLSNAAEQFRQYMLDMYEEQSQHVDVSTYERVECETCTNFVHVSHPGRQISGQPHHISSACVRRRQTYYPG